MPPVAREKLASSFHIGNTVAQCTITFLVVLKVGNGGKDHQDCGCKGPAKSQVATPFLNGITQATVTHQLARPHGLGVAELCSVSCFLLLPCEALVYILSTQLGDPRPDGIDELIRAVGISPRFHVLQRSAGAHDIVVGRQSWSVRQLTYAAEQISPSCIVGLAGPGSKVLGVNEIEWGNKMRRLQKAGG
jgi:hypothetical protein